jgi:hypothetical protein
VGVVDAKTKKRVLATLTAVLKQVHDSLEPEVDEDEESADQAELKNRSSHSLTGATRRRHAVALQLTAPLQAIVQQALDCLPDVAL